MHSVTRNILAHGSRCTPETTRRGLPEDGSPRGLALVCGGHRLALLPCSWVDPFGGSRGDMAHSGMCALSLSSGPRAGDAGSVAQGPASGLLGYQSGSEAAHSLIHWISPSFDSTFPPDSWNGAPFPSLVGKVWVLSYKCTRCKGRTINSHEKDFATCY